MSPVNSKEVNLPPSEISIDVFCKKHELLKRNKIVIQNIGFLTSFQEPQLTHLASSNYYIYFSITKNVG
jgi:hypothetical protein